MAARQRGAAHWPASSRTHGMAVSACKSMDPAIKAKSPPSPSALHLHAVTHQQQGGQEPLVQAPQALTPCNLNERVQETSVLECACLRWRPCYRTAQQPGDVTCSCCSSSGLPCCYCRLAARCRSCCCCCCRCRLLHRFSLQLQPRLDDPDGVGDEAHLRQSRYSKAVIGRSTCRPQRVSSRSAVEKETVIKTGPALFEY